MLFGTPLKERGFFDGLLCANLLFLQRINGHDFNRLKNIGTGLLNNRSLFYGQIRPGLLVDSIHGLG
jgi:hypothetical protein